MSSRPRPCMRLGIWSCSCAGCIIPCCMAACKQRESLCLVWLKLRIQGKPPCTRIVAQPEAARLADDGHCARSREQQQIDACIQGAHLLSHCLCVLVHGRCEIQAEYGKQAQKSLAPSTPLQFKKGRTGRAYIIRNKLYSVQGGTWARLCYRVLHVQEKPGRNE